MSNGVDNTQVVNRFAKQSNITAESFLLTAGQSVVLDLDSYISNKTIQVNEFNTSLVVQISLDGINFFAGPTIGTIGMYTIILPCRYVQLTAGGTCSGLVVGSLTGGGGSSGGGGGGGITELTGDVSAVGPGTAYATVVAVGGATAVQVFDAAVAVENATSLNTPSTLVERDVLGKFNATGINLSGLSASQTVVTDASKNLTSLIYTPSNAGSTIVSRDSAGNSSFNNVNITVTEVVSAGQTIAMTYGSAGHQRVTGSSTVQFNLPDATYMSNGELYRFDNLSTQPITIYKNDGVTLVDTVLSGGLSVVTCIDNSTTNGQWDPHHWLASSATSGTSGTSVPGSLTAATTVTGTQLISNVSTGTAPLIVSSTTQVANLNAANAGTAVNFTGSLSGDVTGGQSTTSISSPTVTGKLLTGYSVGANTPIAATDSILQAFGKVQGQINNTDLTAITALTGDVSATGPGSVSSTVNSVGGSSAANIHSAELAANAATNLNTASTIVKRDASGNFSAGTITASLNGNATNITATSNSTLTTLSSLILPTSQLSGTISLTTQVSGVLPIVNGGTGSNTQNFVDLTTMQTVAGNKTFSGQTAISNNSTNALTINSTSFVFDSTNNAMGIGIQPSTTSTLDTINSGGVPKPIQNTSYGVGSSIPFRGRFARGTPGSPSAAQAGDILSVYSGRGYGTSQFPAASTGVLNIVAGETFTNTSNMTYLQFLATPTGSVTSSEHMRVAATGVTLGGQSAGTDLHTSNGGWVRTTKTITSNYTVDTTTTDDIILCNQSGAITITLPNPTVGRTIVIKDRSGNASTNTITVAPFASEQIEGLAASKVLSTNYGAWTFTVGSAGNWWMI